MTSEGYHEPIDELSPRTRDHHRAIVSLMEELEAVDWYDQRVDATTDPELAAILAHNRDEEKEHAAMTLEWLRRRDPTLDEQLRTYLFTEGDILAVEDEAMGRSGEASGTPKPALEISADDIEAPGRPTPPPGGDRTDGSLGIGSLRRDDYSL